MKQVTKISGIAICNVCLKPCRVVVPDNEYAVKSKCCNATVVHKNVRLTLPMR